MKKWLSLVLFAAMLVVSPQLSRADELPSVVERDQTRIREHLSAVEAYLRTQGTSHLTDAQRIARNENIDRLHDYWLAGVFPQNTLAQHPTPIFVDPDDRACAVAHLMREAGYQAAVDEVVARQNLAYVNDIESSALVEWLHDSGLTAQEAAWIQPTYNPCNDDCACEPDPVCGADGITYVSPCFAERCTVGADYVPGCCQVADRIFWSGDLVPEFGTDARVCPNDPNDMADVLCTEAVTPPPSEDETGGCSAANTRGPAVWIQIVFLLALVALLRRRLHV